VYTPGGWSPEFGILSSENFIQLSAVPQSNFWVKETGSKILRNVGENLAFGAA
jgi:hypothetical protein